MTIAAATRSEAPPVTIDRPDPSLPILHATGCTEIAIRAGTTITVASFPDAAIVTSFPEDDLVTLPDLIPGEDYGVRLGDDGQPFASLLGPENPLDAGWIGGFHYAPGGNATGRAGGDTTPAINPCSIWDRDFRPACPDPRGMALVEMGEARFWVDIYLLGVQHERNGTSRCGATIADGNSLSRLNYRDAVDIYARHGKRLLTYDEFRVAAFGVTEKSAPPRHPKTTGLDAPRTSRFGLMQATGNLWQWGTDGDPDDPRASWFGGSWMSGSFAGSRFALLGGWGGDSSGLLSARGACDHLHPE
ncbi:phage major tropism determinant [Shinella pollutisoli]|uniref:Major tropism determinant second domain-containing protein n=1 Tax=Shinella pollutisoli TaxID=2250594 RepID=A0ABV7D9E9_9HYPH|nr:hypothetical protein [Shinella pollutisoli]